jgi:hypothetical protein
MYDPFVISVTHSLLFADPDSSLLVTVGGGIGGGTGAAIPLI